MFYVSDINTRLMVAVFIPKYRELKVFDILVDCVEYSTVAVFIPKYRELKDKCGRDLAERLGEVAVFIPKYRELKVVIPR